MVTTFVFDTVPTMTKNSWKTTLGGLLLTLGSTLSNSSEPWLHVAGTIMLAASGLFLAQARDNNVSSEDAGAK